MKYIRKFNESKYNTLSKSDIDVIKYLKSKKIKDLNHYIQLLEKELEESLPDESVLMACNDEIYLISKENNLDMNKVLDFGKSIDLIVSKLDEDDVWNKRFN